jgi:hypothetical protein
MRQLTAKTSLSIYIVTAIALVFTAAIAIESFRQPQMSILAVFLSLVCFFAWMTRPVEYELAGGRLTVHSRLRDKQFDGVARCSLVGTPLPTKFWFGIRIFGNGGLFAGTGIFWNRMYGLFRAYVTSARNSDMVLVETHTRKILITPRNPGQFVEAWQAASERVS